MEYEEGALEACNLTNEGFQLKPQANLQLLDSLFNE